MSTQRLVVISGAWDLLSALAAMHAVRSQTRTDTIDTLLLYSVQPGSLPSSMETALQHAAKAAWDWKLIGAAPPRANAEQRIDGDYLEALRGAAGLDHADEVWLSDLWGWTEKAVAAAYPSARILLHEEGMQTYVDTEDGYVSWSRLLRYPRSSVRALRRGRQKSVPLSDLSSEVMCQAHLRRVTASFLILDRTLPLPAYQRRLPCIHVPTESVQAALDGVVSGCAEFRRACVSTALPANAVFVLGQCFSNYGDLSWEEELEAYTRLATDAAGLGIPVLWKEHPRVRRPFGDELRIHVDALEVMPDLGPWPMELYLYHRPPACCVGLTSTTLVIGRALLGVRTYTGVHWIRDKLRYPNNVMAAMIEASVPPISDLSIEVAQSGSAQKAGLELA